ncbi:MAG: HAMP domain-containing protein, partial [Cyanothece sp. SIO1E1]|nr:HAMP domain-containing protein [Cyanothece sp. SIO1E1]
MKKWLKPWPKGDIARLGNDYDLAASGMKKMMASRSDNTAEEVRILDDIRNTEAETLPLIEAVIAAREAGDADRAHQILMSDARPLFVKWLSQINEFIDLQESFNQSEGASVRQTADGFMLETIIAFGVAVLVALALGIWVLRSIRPLRMSTDIMRRLANGDLTVDVPQSRDRHEVGNILRSLDTFKAAAQEKQRLEEMQAERDKAAAEEKERMMNRLASSFEQKVEGMVNAVSRSSEDLLGLAQSLSGLAEDAKQRANFV